MFRLSEVLPDYAHMLHIRGGAAQPRGGRACDFRLEVDSPGAAPSCSFDALAPLVPGVFEDPWGALPHWVLEDAYSGSPTPPLAKTLVAAKPRPNTI
jgi:hypothetical protein